VWERATLQTASDSLDVALHDGSRIQLLKETRLALAEAEATAVEIALERGRVDCDVVPNPARRFVVRAAGVEVRVTGTRFSVERQGSRISVTVDRGSVEIGRHDDATPLRRLSAGERWSLDTSEAHALREPVQAPEPLEPKPSSVPDPTPTSLEARKQDSLTDRGAASEPDPAKPMDLSAKQLLERANQARRDGDARAAAQDYQLLLNRFPGDGRAGLSAFELGRLRMDRLGDLPGAVEALKRAVQLAPGSGFREDAMARLVTAYQRTGQTSACKQARERYLSAYPSGVHAQKVARACASSE
jgi:transmembrane sensor